MHAYPVLPRNAVIVLVFCLLGAMFGASAYFILTRSGFIPTPQVQRKSPQQSAEEASVRGTPPGQANFALAEEQDNLSQLMAKLQATPTDYALLMEISEQFIEVEEWARAQAFLSRAVLAKPQSIPPRFLLGLAQYREGKGEAAAETMQGILDIAEDPLALYNLAIIYSHQIKQPQKAAAYWQRLEKAPGADEQLRTRAKQELAKIAQ